MAGAAGIGWGTADASAPGGTFGDEALDTMPFHGAHQAGIETMPPQVTRPSWDSTWRPGRPRGHYRAAPYLDRRRGRLTQGMPALADTEPELAAATGPAHDHRRLGTATCSPSRGSPERRPSWLHQLPPFPIDRLDPATPARDLLLQVCAEEATTVSHAVRVLSKHVKSLVTVRWVQRGFRDAPKGQTMRNLMGQVDGTVNIAPRTLDFDRLVWDDGAVDAVAGRRHLAGAAPRSPMDLDTWDELDAERSANSPSAARWPTARR